MSLSPSNTQIRKSSAFTPRVRPIALRRWSLSGKGCVVALAPFAPGVARGLKLRHDHGSNYMSGDFQDEIKCLGIEASPSFVREPEGNGVAERFIRTLKENLLWVRSFDTIEELRAELIAFAKRYNETWLVERHGYQHPLKCEPLNFGLPRQMSESYPWQPEISAVGCLKTGPQYTGGNARGASYPRRWHAAQSWRQNQPQAQ